MTSKKDNSKRTAIFLQDACLQHRYIRSRDLSAIVERPERLRAVAVGLSAAIARLEGAFSVKADELLPVESQDKEKTLDPDELATAMAHMNLIRERQPPPVSIVRSNASLDVLNHPAVKYIHGDLEGDTYLKKLEEWARDSCDKIQKEGTEIPKGLSQGDLYLCPESIVAIQGALGTVCEAVDKVVHSSSLDVTTDKAHLPEDLPVHRAFVAIRPPGHHCGEDTPSGFCFVNNVAVGAAHAYLQHNIKRVVIFDIDLHHGNGTQSIVWQVNEDTYREKLEKDEENPLTQPGLQIYYGSVHDILSYPCEDGKPDLIQAASVSIHQAHGQYIENVHLQTYESEQHFWDVLYNEQYGRILRKAEDFLDETGGPGDDVMVFISCGMDACEHEYASMSRHNRNVPTSLYHRFARDACALSDRHARGRLVSILEGGYSDRALMSGAMAHLSGLVDDTESRGGRVQDEWWSVENLTKLEQATKRRRGGRPSLPGTGSTEQWLERTLEIFQSLDSTTTKSKAASSSRGIPLPPTSMALRGRKDNNTASAPLSNISHTDNKLKAKGIGKVDKTEESAIMSHPVSDNQLSSSNTSERDAERPEGVKKLPRVILRLGPDPTISSVS